jgi:hypothetical protein
VRTLATTLLLLACSTPAPPAEPSRIEREATFERIANAAPLRVELRTQLASRAGESALVLRVTNESDRPLLVDLRDVDRVVSASSPALRLPLSDAQRDELDLISALNELRPGRSLSYATPFVREPWDGSRTVHLGGVLVALDGDRVIELVADGADAQVSCDEPTALPPGAIWVAGHAPFTAAARDVAAFATDLPSLVRAASVGGTADVALLAFSYDPLPIERWRYDACVSTGSCPARAVAQPPGSIQRPAVGMDTAGVAAFCATRALRSPADAELAVMGDAPRPLIDAGDGIIRGGFRCARSEAP